jgi:hypothetical protein
VTPCLVQTLSHSVGRLRSHARVWRGCPCGSSREERFNGRDRRPHCRRIRSRPRDHRRAERARPIDARLRGRSRSSESTSCGSNKSTRRSPLIAPRSAQSPRARMVRNRQARSLVWDREKEIHLHRSREIASGASIPFESGHRRPVLVVHRHAHDVVVSIQSPTEISGRQPVGASGGSAPHAKALQQRPARSGPRDSHSSPNASFSASHVRLSASTSSCVPPRLSCLTSRVAQGAT